MISSISLSFSYLHCCQGKWFLLSVIKHLSGKKSSLVVSVLIYFVTINLEPVFSATTTPVVLGDATDTPATILAPGGAATFADSFSFRYGTSTSLASASTSVT
jgi:hypothetical protein